MLESEVWDILKELLMFIFCPQVDKYTVTDIKQSAVSQIYRRQ